MGLPPIRYAAIPTLLIIAMLLGGCIPVSISTSQCFDRPHSSYMEAWRQWTEQNPCGHVTIAPPLVNITGYIAAGQKLPPSVVLFVTPNVTEDAARHVRSHCRYIMRVKPNERRQVVFANIPAGLFVLAAPNPNHEFRILKTVGVSSGGEVRTYVDWIETPDGWEFIILNISRADQ